MVRGSYQAVERICGNARPGSQRPGSIPTLCHDPHPRPGYLDAPLFPGYLFVHCDLDERGSSQITRIPSVAGLVSFGGVMPAIPDDLMEDLRQRIEAINESGGVWTSFRRGDLVRVLMGPSESLGEVLEEARSTRSTVRVLLDFLGHTVEARVPRKNLEPVGNHRRFEVVRPQPPRRTRGRGRWIRRYGTRSAA